MRGGQAVAITAHLVAATINKGLSAWCKPRRLAKGRSFFVVYAISITRRCFTDGGLTWMRRASTPSGSPSV